MKRKRIGKGLLKKSGKILVRAGSVFIILTSAQAAGASNATDATKAVIGYEGGREALNSALKFVRAKPVMLVATTITCLAMVGAIASPGMCIACGILIAKTLG